VDAESAMAPYWTVCPGLKASLFAKGRKGYFDLKVAKADIKATIYDHPEFADFIAQMNAHFAVWKKVCSTTTPIGRWSIPTTSTST
jgi:type I restriction enzyme M protein